eukprot:9486718-Pyramimonas_sp.AAC.1
MCKIVASEGVGGGQILQQRRLIVLEGDGNGREAAERASLLKVRADLGHARSVGGGEVVAAPLRSSTAPRKKMSESPYLRMPSSTPGLTELADQWRDRLILSGPSQNSQLLRAPCQQQRRREITSTLFTSLTSFSEELTPHASVFPKFRIDSSCT